MNPLYILIALKNQTDSEKLAQSIQHSIFNAQINIVSEEDFIKMALIQLPDFVIVEGLRSFEFTRIIKSIPRAYTKCIICINQPADEVLIPAIFANADAYYDLDFADQSMTDCINRLRGGERYITPILIPKFIKHNKADEYRKISQQLTRQEREIFRYLGYNHPTKEIAERLFISNKTVDTHKNNIISKLKLSGAKALRQLAAKLVYTTT